MSWSLRAGALPALVLALLGILTGSLRADAQTPSVVLHVLAAGATQAVVRPLAQQYTQQTGTPIDVVAGTVGQLLQRLAEGQAADVVLLSMPALDTLDGRGGLAAGTKHAVGRTGTGVCARAGAPLPDIATTDAFKKTLLAATSIAYTDPKSGASSGIYFANLLQRLGIADAVNPKATLQAGGYVCDLVAKGKVQLGIQNLTEIVPVKGVTLVGMLPADIQNYITYGVAVNAKAAAPAAAGAFAAYLVRPATQARWKAAGFEPPQGP